MNIYWMVWAIDELSEGREPWHVSAHWKAPYRGPSRFELMGPNRISVESAAWYYVHTEGQETDIVFASDPSIPGVNDRTRALFERADPGAIQWVPANFLGREDEKWWHMQVLHHADCLDEERSQLEWWGGFEGKPDKVRRPIGIYHAVLRKRDIGDRAIFRLKRYPSHLYVTQEIVDLCKFNNITGAAFIPADVRD